MVELGSSFLEPGLVKAGIVKRVDSVENADLCYWDAQARTFRRVQIQTQRYHRLTPDAGQEGDRLDHWLEATWRWWIFPSFSMTWQISVSD